MNLTVDARNKLADEVEYIVERMKAESDPRVQMYFFSAAYSEAGRILNYNWSEDLALIQVILQAAYGAINSRIESMASGRDPAIRLPDEFMAALIGATEVLARVLRDDDRAGMFDVIAKFSALAYLTTGNGFYLYERRAAKL